MIELVPDPYDRAIDADPHPVWRRMRDEAPLYRNDAYDFLALSRFRGVLGVSEEDREQIRAWTDETLHREPGEVDPTERVTTSTVRDFPRLPIRF